MKAEFDGTVYLHPMIAERQREIAVSLKALHMMQEHHGNRYFSFKCVSHEEEREWYAKAEKLVPPVKRACVYPDCDGGHATGRCHSDCPRQPILRS